MSYARTTRACEVLVANLPGATTEGDLRKYVASASGVTPTFLRYSDGYSSNSGGRVRLHSNAYPLPVSKGGRCSLPSLDPRRRTPRDSVGPRDIR